MAVEIIVLICEYKPDEMHVQNDTHYILYIQLFHHSFTHCGSMAFQYFCRNTTVTLIYAQLFEEQMAPNMNVDKSKRRVPFRFHHLWWFP